MLNRHVQVGQQSPLGGHELDQRPRREELAVLEAMKMENALRAERNGVIVKLHFKAGESVEVDQVIMELE